MFVSGIVDDNLLVLWGDTNLILRSGADIVVSIAEDCLQICN